MFCDLSLFGAGGRAGLLGLSGHLVLTGTHDLNGRCWLLIDDVNLLHDLKGSHTRDNATEDNIFSVEEGKGSACCHIELAFVAVSIALSLAHTHQTHFGVLHMEAFISKFAVEHRSAVLYKSINLKNCLLAPFL